MNALKHLIGLSVAMLDKAPGEKLLIEWHARYKKQMAAGDDQTLALQAVARHIAESADFSSRYPLYLEGELFARPFLRTALGEEPADAIVAAAVELLEGGATRAEMGLLVVRVLLEIADQGTDHPDYATYGTFALRFANKVEVAQYYTVTKRWADADGSVLERVNEEADSVITAKAEIDDLARPGKEFELTVKRDAFKGSEGNDTFIATERTLGGLDRLDGADGNDTLRLSASSDTSNIRIPNGLQVRNIETLSVTTAQDFRGDLEDWEGLQTVVLDVSTTAKVELMGKGIESVMVEGGRELKVSTGVSPSTTLKSVSLDGMHAGLGKDGNRGGTDDNADDKEATVQIYSTAIQDLTVQSTNTTVMLQNHADGKGKGATGMLKVMVDRFGVRGNDDRYGKLSLKGMDELMLQVDGDSHVHLHSSGIKQMKVAGDGYLTLDVKRLGNVKTVDASQATGEVKLINLGKSVATYKGSKGGDEASVTGFNTGGLMADLGAGDDQFTISSGVAVTGKSRIDGGTGEDTLTLAVKRARDWKGVNDKVFMNFEKTSLEVEAIAGSGGTYDAGMPGLDELKVVEGVAKGKTPPKVRFKNIRPETDLVVDGGQAVKVRIFDLGFTLKGGTEDKSISLQLQSFGAGSDPEVTIADDRKQGATRWIALQLNNLQLGKSTKKLTVDSTVVFGESTLESDAYLNRITMLKADGLEELTVTGNTALSLRGFKGDKLKTINARSLQESLWIDSTTTFTAATEIHGSDFNDSIVFNKANRTAGYKDKVMGYDGDDVIFTGKGADTITGGAGGDELSGNRWGAAKRADGARDTFVYTAASDSRVRFDADKKPIGMDVIFGFDPGAGAAKDSIDLSDVVSLTGTIKKIETGGSLSLWTYLYGDDGAASRLFRSDATDSAFGESHDVALLQSQEYLFDDIPGSKINIVGRAKGNSADNVKVYWVLVDVDGNGDFDRSTDMAIALIGNVDYTEKLLGSNFAV